MKCSNCPQFTSKDTDTEPEGDLEVDDEGSVTGDVRIVNNCAECGSELEETTFSVEIDLTDEVAAHMKEKHPDVLAARAEAEKKPAKAVKLPPLVGVDAFDNCKNCHKYFMSHVDPKSGLAVGQHPKKQPKDARALQCPKDWSGRRRAGTTFEPGGKGKAADRDLSLSVESEMSRTDETVTKDRKGRQIKRSRYMKRLYGVEVSATVTCDTCGETIGTGEFKDSIQASGMDWIG